VPPRAGLTLAGHSGNLRLRILSAAVMIPVALLAVWLGAWFLTVLVVLVVAAMEWEWGRLTGGEPLDLKGVLAILTGVSAVVAAAAGWVGAGIALLGLGTIAVFFAAPSERAWFALGVAWIGAASASFMALAIIAGRPTLLWLLAVVWASDIGAYAAGRSIGGPKLAPRLSPNKTWAGFLGGLCCAGLVGALFGGTGAGPVVVGMSLGLGFVAQLGDLAESFAKRHFKVKDSSHLIPGHGGVLDRVDSLLAAAVVLAAIMAVEGSSPLLWR